MGMREGERHYGEYKNLLKQTDTQLGRSIRSYVAEIAEHSSKLNNPSALYTDWHLKDVREQEGALRFWRKEINSLEAKLAIARTIAEERGL
jgi:hypothetical protein